MTKRIAAADREGLEEAAQKLRQGELVAFPTETVYGLGANAFNAKAVAEIFAAKGRPSDNPLIVHIAQAKQAEEFAEVSERARKLFDRFSPGPLTVILPKKEGIPERVTAGLNSIAVRIPGNAVARELIRLAGVPIAAPSANRSGSPSPTDADSVLQDLDGRIWGVVDDGNCQVGIESTIVDVTGELPVILRPGGVTLEQIQEILPECTLDVGLFKKPIGDFRPKAPGMKYKHYAPRAQVIAFEGNSSAVRREIETYIATHSHQKIGVFAMDGNCYEQSTVLHWGKNAQDMAKHLFHALRQFDELGIDVILCEPPETGGMGTSVRNRLYKAAGFHIVCAEEEQKEKTENE